MSNQPESEEKGNIKIVDRRRFDSAGEEKTEGYADQTVISTAKPQTAARSTAAEFVPDEPAPVLKEKASESTGTRSESSGPAVSEEDEISFGSFVLSLATQALMLMGQLKPPDGVPVSVDPAAAKQTIDILSMLDHKTKGNLSTQEANLLKDALHNLRMAFLKFG